MNVQFLFDLSAFLVAVSIAYATWMWWIEWRHRYPIPVQNLSRIFAVAFCVQGLIYLVFSFIVIDIELRSYLVRVSISTICFSQAIPLHVAYRAWRSDGL